MQSFAQARTFFVNVVAVCPFSAFFCQRSMSFATFFASSVFAYPKEKTLSVNFGFKEHRKNDAPFSSGAEFPLRP
jgi:hypothetical protein